MLDLVRGCFEGNPDWLIFYLKRSLPQVKGVISPAYIQLLGPVVFSERTTKNKIGKIEKKKKRTDQKHFS